MVVETAGGMPFGKYDAKSCGAVVFRVEDGQPRYLVMHYAAGHWDLMKGHTEPGETEEATTRRECVEETGITDLQFHPSFRKTYNYTYEHEGRPVRKHVVMRLALTSTPADRIQLSREHQAYAWLDIDGALDRLTYDNSKALVRDAHETIIDGL